MQADNAHIEMRHSMHRDEHFEFVPGPRGDTQTASLLLAAVAIAAILIVNSGALMAKTSNQAQAPVTQSAKQVPALLETQPARAPSASKLST
jgi:hypothetical protein